MKLEVQTYIHRETARLGLDKEQGGNYVLALNRPINCIYTRKSESYLKVNDVLKF